MSSGPELTDLKDLCRLCLKSAIMFTALDDTLLALIQQLFTIEDVTDPALPQRVCLLCKQKVHDFHRFLQNVKSNQIRLKKMVVKIKQETDMDSISENDLAVVFDDFEMSKPNTDQDGSSDKNDDFHDDDDSSNTEPETSTEIKCEVIIDSPRKSKAKKSSDKISPTKKPKKKRVIIDSSDNDENESNNEMDDCSGIRDGDEDKQIHEFFNLSCVNCSISFKKFSKWKNHVKNKHKEPNPGIICCGKRLTRRHQLVTHIVLHRNPADLRCTVCGRQCKNKHRLKEHMETHHNGSNELFQCDACPRQFSTKTSLKQHHLTHIDDQEKDRLKAANTCIECGIGFLSRSKLMQHVRYRHGNEYCTVCNACGKTFKNKYNFLTHYQNNHGDGASRPQCSICALIVSDESSLRRHIRNKHDNAGDHTCTVCNKQCPSKNALKAHIDYVHSKERKFSCHYCEKAFKRAVGLKEHLTTHVGGALYRCTFCEKTFNSGANMYAHRKRAHPNELKLLQEQGDKGKVAVLTPQPS